MISVWTSLVIIRSAMLSAWMWHAAVWIRCRRRQPSNCKHRLRTLFDLSLAMTRTRQFRMQNAFTVLSGSSQGLESIYPWGLGLAFRIGCTLITCSTSNAASSSRRISSLQRRQQFSEFTL